MSTTIDENIRELEQDLTACRQIRQKFPDALADPFNVWVSASLMPEACVALLIGQHDVVRAGTLVEGKLVARPIRSGLTIAGLLRRLSEEQPELYLALARFAGECV
jgi:hypothetical protein